MINDDIHKLENVIQGLQGLDSKKKAELLGLIDSLKAQTDRLTQTHTAIGRLAQSIKAFEGAHPKLVEVVDEISHMLSQIGI
jgi:hypothetical protein